LRVVFVKDNRLCQLPNNFSWFWFGVLVRQANRRPVPKTLINGPVQQAGGTIRFTVCVFRSIQ
jgi:hypothetical protein